jgi:hypothetical protein
VNTAKSREEGQQRGAARKRAMTALVKRFKPVWTRRIQRALLHRLIEEQVGTTDDIRPTTDTPAEAGTSVWGQRSKGSSKPG